MCSAHAGYFPSYKLTESDFYSLQVKPDEFKTQLTICEKIADFFRMILSFETKSSALTHLNEIMHKNHLVNNPIEMLAALEKILPDEIREKVKYCFHCEVEWDEEKLKIKGGKKIKAIDIKYNDKSITINPEQCWLTDYDEEIIERLRLNGFEKYGDESNNDEINEIDWNKNSNGVNSREDFIYNTISNGVINSSTEKKNCFVRIIYNNDDKLVKLERVVLMADGYPHLAIQLKPGEEGGIQEFCNDFGIRIVKKYTTSPYVKTTDELKSLDNILACLDYDKIVADYKLIDDAIKIIENLKGLIQLNEIVRQIDIHTNVEKMKCGNFISTALDAVKDIKKNKLEREAVSNNIENIKKNIIFFKNNIVFQSYLDSNDKTLSINYAEDIIESAKKKLTPDENKAGLTDTDLDIPNMKEFVKYCKESLNLKPTVQNTKNIANEKDIVDIQQLSNLERKIDMYKAFNRLYYFASNDDKSSTIITNCEIEDLLLVCQQPDFINNEKKKVSKLVDELWVFNPKLFIPGDFYNEYLCANKTLVEKIKTKLSLLHDDPELFKTEVMSILDEIYTMKSEFLGDYMKYFDAERMSESQDGLTMFKSILSRIKQNKAIDEDKKYTWLLRANK
ncbi:hypothetical protein [Yersinia bercovieri]|uniref:hypothetical protein n=1 Tax=Yersinia bercovieri TaxID=634 RepID=UPI0011A876D2|nr:hypothetical protein [Yersinia bercovieri]